MPQRPASLPPVAKNTAQNEKMKDSTAAEATEVSEAKCGPCGARAVFVATGGKVAEREETTRKPGDNATGLGLSSCVLSNCI